MNAMLAEFRKFAFKGSMIDLAVGIVLGVAFGAVIKSLVDDIIQPIIGAVFGVDSLNNKSFDIGDGVVVWGAFLGTLINFVIVAFVLFLIVKFVNNARERFMKTDEATEEPTEDVALLREIRDALTNR